MRYSWEYWIIIKPPIIRINRSMESLTVFVKAAIKMPNEITHHAKKKDNGNMANNLAGIPIFEIHPFKRKNAIKNNRITK
jgi:hypothetical protein